MKPVTAAAKLGIYLPAAPEEFRTSPITRGLAAQRTLSARGGRAEAGRVPFRTRAGRHHRAVGHGPFPREVVAQKVGVSRSGLARAGITEPLDADQIGTLIAEPPEWLVRERESYREVVAEKARQSSR